MPYELIDDQELDKHIETPQELPPPSEAEKSSFYTKHIKPIVKMATVPAARVIEKAKGLTGDLIELPSDVTQLGYGLAGKEPPNWTVGPSSLRVNEKGEIREPLKTSGELRKEKIFGEYGEPSTKIEKELSDFASIGSDVALSGGKGKAALGTIGGIYGGKKASEAIETPPLISFLFQGIGGALGGALSNKRPPSEVASAEGKKLAAISEKEGFKNTPAAVLQAGRNPSMTTKILRYWGKADEKTKNRAADFAQEVEGVTDEVLSNIHKPYRHEKDVDKLLSDAKSLYKPARAVAEKFGNQVDNTPYRKAIEDGIERLSKPNVLGAQSEGALKKLREMQANLNKGFFDLPAAIDTYQELNKIIGGDILTKGDVYLKNTQKALKQSILDSGKNADGFNDLFLGANEATHQAYNLKSATELLSKAFTDKGFSIEGFHDVFKNKKNVRKLSRAIGVGNYNRLKNVADLSSDAKKNFDAVGASLPADLNYLYKEIGSASGLVESTTAAGTLLMRNLAGRMLTKPDMYKNYLGFVASVAGNKPKMTLYFLRQLQKELPEEEKESNK